MIFNYEISDQSGKISKGSLEAPDIAEARNILALKNVIVISLNPSVEKKEKKRTGEITFGRVKLLEKVMLAKHLSIMIKSGMAIDEAIETLVDNSSPVLAKQLRGILEDIRKGNPLSVALKKRHKDFDNLFVNIVAVGEAGGSLAENLLQLSVQLRKSYELRAKLRAASLYPTIVLISIIGLIAIMSVFVLPRIIGFFTALRVELPLATKILLAVAGFLIQNWLLTVIIILALIVALKVMAKLKATRYFIHKLILRLPGVGRISRDINLAMFNRTLSSLLASGITIDRALQIVSQTLTNEVFVRHTAAAYHNVLKGASLASSFPSNVYFPGIVSRMIKVGERSGNLSEVLEHLAEFYEIEVDNSTKNLSTVIEPALLIIIGLVVGFVALAIINPIYQLTSSVSGR